MPACKIWRNKLINEDLLQTHACSTTKPLKHMDEIEELDSKHQMVPLNVRNRNAVERSMCTFKEHFLECLLE